MFFNVQFQVKIWFQNRRTKWKKQENISNAEAAELMKAKKSHKEATAAASMLSNCGLNKPVINAVTNGLLMGKLSPGPPPSPFLRPSSSASSSSLQLHQEQFRQLSESSSKESEAEAGGGSPRPEVKVTCDEDEDDHVGRLVIADDTGHDSTTSNKNLNNNGLYKAVEIIFTPNKNAEIQPQVKIEEDWFFNCIKKSVVRASSIFCDVQHFSSHLQLFTQQQIVCPGHL